MIFTLGHTESYERYFQEQGTPQKMGARPDEDYPGGSVWRTRESAERHRQPDFSVYGVRADWEIETTPSAEGDWHDLLVDADLVRLGG